MTVREDQYDITRAELAMYKDYTDRLIKEGVKLGYNRVKHGGTNTLVLVCVQSTRGDYAVSAGGIEYLRKTNEACQVSYALVALTPRDITAEIKFFSVERIAAEVAGIDPLPGGSNSPFYWLTADGRLPANSDLPWVV